MCSAVASPLQAQSLMELMTANTGQAALAGGAAGAAAQTQPSAVPQPVAAPASVPATAPAAAPSMSGLSMMTGAGGGALPPPQQPQMPLSLSPPPQGAAPVALPGAPSAPKIAMPDMSGMAEKIKNLPLPTLPGQERIEMPVPQEKDGKVEIPSFQGFDSKAAANPNRIKSLFYSQAEISDIHLAVNTYLKHVSNNDALSFDEESFLNRLGGLKRASNAQSRYFTYPQFFLDSMVYHSAENWIVWVNGRKLANDTPKDGTNIQVAAVTPEMVTLEWFPSQMDRVLEIWNQLENPAVQSQGVQVDVAKAKVTFSLKPNQTFSSYTMNVLEGKALPVTVDIAALGNLQGSRVSLDGQSVNNETAVPAAADKDDDKTATPQKAQESKEGLGGLIRSYQNMPHGEQKP